MPPEKHALLGASSAHRWLNCPGSARLQEWLRQMMLYAWGALRYFKPIFGDSIHAIHVSIVQPNAGGVREWETGVWELAQWARNYLDDLVSEQIEADNHA